MKINENLLKLANYDPTKESKQLNIFGLCSKIEKNNLSLPLYQRDMSWTLQKSISLLNFQLLGKSPVSPISVNIIEDINESVPQIQFLSREIIEISNGQYSVVDGQQRLTTNYKAYINHDDYKNIVLDLKKGKFILINSQIRKHQIPVGVLYHYDEATLTKYISGNKFLSLPEIFSGLLQIRSKFKNYYYTINLSHDLSEDEQIEWFEVLNNAGSRVTTIQMRFSKLKAYGLDIYKDYANVYKQLVLDCGFDLFKPLSTGVSYPIAALNPIYEKEILTTHKNNFAPIPSDVKEDQLCNLNVDTLKEYCEITLEYLKKALSFIKDNGLRNPERVDYINYLIGYFIFHSDEDFINQKSDLISWCNTVNFTDKSNSERRSIYTNLITM